MLDPRFSFDDLYSLKINDSNIIPRKPSLNIYRSFEIRENYNYWIIVWTYILDSFPVSLPSPVCICCGRCVHTSAESPFRCWTPRGKCSKCSGHPGRQKICNNHRLSSNTCCLAHYGWCSHSCSPKGDLESDLLFFIVSSSRIFWQYNNILKLWMLRTRRPKSKVLH